MGSMTLNICTPGRSGPNMVSSPILVFRADFVVALSRLYPNKKKKLCTVSFRDKCWDPPNAGAGPVFKRAPRCSRSHLHHSGFPPPLTCYVSGTAVMTLTNNPTNLLNFHTDMTPYNKRNCPTLKFRIKNQIYFYLFSKCFSLHVV